MSFMEARARRSDPETSHAAAASVVEMTTKQAAVLRLLRQHRWGISDRTLVDTYHYARHLQPELFPKQSESGIRTRRKELVDLGLAMDSGKRERLPSGRMAVVWVQTCEGQAGTFARRAA